LAGTDLAQALIAKDSIAAKKAAMPADVAKALARLSRYHLVLDVRLVDCNK
jgi:hypothetical protein